MIEGGEKWEDERQGNFDSIIFSRIPRTLQLPLNSPDHLVHGSAGSCLLMEQDRQTGLGGIGQFLSLRLPLEGAGSGCSPDSDADCRVSLYVGTSATFLRGGLLLQECSQRRHLLPLHTEQISQDHLHQRRFRYQFRTRRRSRPPTQTSLQTLPRPPRLPIHNEEDGKDVLGF